MTSLAELSLAFQELQHDESFRAELTDLLRDFAGRPTPLYYARRFSARFQRPDGSGPRVYLKREDLAHTGSHKINNALAQVLLAKRLGKSRVIAETGAGQHGIAAAAACARCDMQCVVYIGEKDARRHCANVELMNLLGADVRVVTRGGQTIASAVSEAIRDWVTFPDETHFLVGTVCGPHPYPQMVRDFQKVIGEEVRQQAMHAWQGRPDVIVACVGGGSNAIGIFHEWKSDSAVRLVGVEAGGKGISAEMHSASLATGTLGVLHGCMSYILQDRHGMPVQTHSMCSGMDYPGVGPEHSYLRDTGRGEYVSVTDVEAVMAHKRLCREEGIVAALETCHAIAYTEKLCAEVEGSPVIVVCCSGRGEKDVRAVCEYDGGY